MDILLGLAFSTHMGLQGTYNDFHPHIRLQDQSLIAGAYYNSEENISLYVGREFREDRFGLELGVVSGYDTYYSPLMPMARVTYDLTEDHKFYVAPALEKYDGESNTGIVFGLEFQLK